VETSTYAESSKEGRKCIEAFKLIGDILTTIITP